MLDKITTGMMLEGADVLVEKRAEAITKSGKAYLRLTVRDKTADVSGVMWGYDPEKHSFIKEGSVIKIWCEVADYNGTTQITVRDVEPSMESIMSFAKSTKFDVEEMWNDIVGIVDEFKEPLTKYVTEEILIKQAKVIEAFKLAPAARGVHNAWFGGLIEHVHSLCTMAKSIIPHYQKRYCEKISSDKVFFGLIMHDAGKIVEYDYSNPAFKNTPVGNFVNHIVVGPAWVYETANRFPDKKSNFKLERAHLMHLIAAHHNTQEWGSPVSPASVEAVIVHHMDNLDASVLHALDYVMGKPSQTEGFSERSYITRTSFYQPK